MRQVITVIHIHNKKTPPIKKTRTHTQTHEHTNTQIQTQTRTYFRPLYEFVYCESYGQKIIKFALRLSKKKYYNAVNDFPQTDLLSARSGREKTKRRENQKKKSFARRCCTIRLAIKSCKIRKDCMRGKCQRRLYKR